MRLCKGPPPLDKDFDPILEQWEKIANIRNKTFAFITYLVLISAIVFGFFLLPKPGNLFCLIVLLLIQILLHELTHALFFPDNGLSKRTIIGWLPKANLFYAHYMGPIEKKKLLLSIISPLIFLSILPIIMLQPFIFIWWGFSWFVMFNASGSILDVLHFYRIFIHVPNGAVVRYHESIVYWKSMK